MPSKNPAAPQVVEESRKSIRLHLRIPSDQRQCKNMNRVTKSPQFAFSSIAMVTQCLDIKTTPLVACHPTILVPFCQTHESALCMHYVLYAHLQKETHADHARVHPWTGTPLMRSIPAFLQAGSRSLPSSAALSN
jgi:hypothetical protein